jgi:hypothetical protein
MIGLDEVRAVLGDRWEKLASRVYGIADRILNARLSKEDVFRRDAAGNYIICFARLCDEQAWFKAKAIGQEIRETLVGDEADDSFAEFQLDVATRERLSGVKAETYEINVSEDEIDAVPDITALLRGKVREASGRFRKRAAAVLVQLAESVKVEFLSVQSRTTRRIQSARFDAASRMLVERLCNVYDDSPKLLAQLDALLLGKTLEKIYETEDRENPVSTVASSFRPSKTATLCAVISTFSAMPTASRYGPWHSRSAAFRTTSITDGYPRCCGSCAISAAFCPSKSADRRSAISIPPKRESPRCPFASIV